MVTNSDILSEMRVLADGYGKADSGTISSLTCKKFINFCKEDSLTDWYICFLNGNNRGIDRFITSYTQNTGEIEFTPTPNPITSTSEFAVIADGYLSYAESATDRIIEDFKNISKDYELFVTPSQLKQITLYYTMSLICLDKFHDGVSQDLYWSRYEAYQNSYNTAFSSFKADYDKDKNGVITDNEKSNNTVSCGVVQR